MYKVAEGTPAGCVKIRITCKPDGKFEGKILEHGPNTGCQMENDDALLNDLLNTEVEGFGKTGEVLDAGHTREYFEETKQRTPSSPEAEAPFAGMPPAAEEEERTPDMGYGV